MVGTEAAMVVKKLASKPNAGKVLENIFDDGMDFAGSSRRTKLVLYRPVEDLRLGVGWRSNEVFSESRSLGSDCDFCDARNVFVSMGPGPGPGPVRMRMRLPR